MATWTITTRPFAKSRSSLDIVSFDVGTVHLGVVRVRYDTQLHRCCIVEAAVVDVYAPRASLRGDEEFRAGAASARARRKPDRIEPFHGSTWPDAPQPAPPLADAHAEQHQQLLDVAQRERSAPKRRQRASVLWELQFQLLPLALDCVPWLHDADIDRVLVEQQQYDNTVMRCISYAIVGYFTTRRSALVLQAADPDADLQRRALGRHCALQIFPSTLKLNKAYVNTLTTTCAVDTLSEPLHASLLQIVRPGSASSASSAQARAESTDDDVEPASNVHDELVSHASHAHKKVSAIRVVDSMFDAHTHPFGHWLEAQRQAKHNVCDALLQAFAWILQWRDCNESAASSATEDSTQRRAPKRQRKTVERQPARKRQRQ